MRGGPTPQHTAPKGSAANIPTSCVHALMNQRWHKENVQLVVVVMRLIGVRHA